MSELPSQLSLRFSSLTLRFRTPHGAVYTGKSFIGEEISLAVLSETAADDDAVREAFAAAVRDYRQAGGTDRPQVHSADVGAGQPWVALRGRSGAEQILAAATGTATVPPGPPPAQGWPIPTTIQQPPTRDWSAPPAAEQPPTWPPGTPVPAQAAASSAPTQTAATPVPRTPQPGNRTASRRLIIVATVALAMVTMAVAASVGNILSSADGEAPPMPQVITSPPAGTDETPPPTDETPAAAAPSLRDVPAISVIGPTWQDGDDTVVWSESGWPFAFRVPFGWRCLPATYSVVPEAPALQCVDLREPDGPRVNLMLWQCPTTCTDDEQRDMIETWLDLPEQAVRAEPQLAYVETDRDARDLYTVDLSHFMTDPADPEGPLRWHLGVYLEAPPESNQTVLKILNDIIGQTS